MKIAIAEDDPVSLKLLQKMLEKWGHEVYPARDGATVLKKIEEMDLDVKVMICTGKVEDENLLDLLEKAHGYVRKPFTMNEIASLLGSEAGKEEAVARMSGLG